MRAGKGQVSFLFGILIVFITAAIFAFGVTVKHSEQRQIVSNSAELYHTVDVAEKLKRTIDADAAFLAKSVLPGLASEGGGFGTWTGSGPNQEQLASELAGRIAKTLVIDVNGMEVRMISWKPATVDISPTETGFDVKGNVPFEVKSILTNPQNTIESPGGFENSIRTSYFKLAADGNVLVGQCASITLGETKSDSMTRQIANISESYPEQLVYAVNITDPAEPLKLGFTLNCTAP
jgi:hypothetical protein